MTSAPGSVTEIPVDEWGHRLKSAAGHNSAPLIFRASVEFTERCNLRCVQCYISQPAGCQEVRQRELSLAQWGRVLDEMVDVGLLWLLITGGEPLLRPDFLEFYISAKKRGIHTTVFTNGTLLTPEIADAFVEYPPWRVEVTLYGATEQIYERVTRVPGSYARCRRGIDLLLSRGVDLALKMTVVDLNAAELHAAEKLAADLGTEFRYDAVLFPRFDGDHRGLYHRLTPEQVVSLERNDGNRRQGWEEACSKPVVARDPHRLFLCGAGLKTYHISAYGELTPCMMVRWLSYDLLAGSLREALDGFLPSVRRIETQKQIRCRTCRLAVLCPRCPAWAYYESGDPESQVDYACQLSVLRSQEVLNGTKQALHNGLGGQV